MRRHSALFTSSVALVTAVIAMAGCNPHVLASVELEAGIARPRALHIGRGPTAWSVRAVRYAEVTQGWFPERLEVFRGDAPEATWAVLDAARTVGGLSPLPTLAPQAPARLPWLPL